MGGVQAADRVVSAANEGATADPALDDERDSVAPSERGEATGGAGAPVEGCPDLHPLVQARCVRATAHPGKEDRPIQRDDREAPGQPRGGFGTRACVISDAIGRAAFVLAPGQGHELPHAHPAVGQAARGAEVGGGAVRGYSSHAFRKHVWSVGARSAIPTRRNEEPPSCPPWIYTNRDHVEMTCDHQTLRQDGTLAHEQPLPRCRVRPDHELTNPRQTFGNLSVYKPFPHIYRDGFMINSACARYLLGGFNAYNTRSLGSYG